MSNRLGWPVQAVSGPVVALAPPPVVVHTPDINERLAGLLLQVVMHSSRRYELCNADTQIVVRAVPACLIEQASDLLAEVGL